MDKNNIEYKPDPDVLRILQNLSGIKKIPINKILDEIVRCQFKPFRGTNDNERRRFSRVSVNIPAVVEHSMHKRECTIIPVQIQDISMGGVKITATLKMDIDKISDLSALRLIFSAQENGKPVSFRCAPSRMKTSDYITDLGLRFIDGLFHDYKLLAERLQHSDFFYA